MFHKPKPLSDAGTCSGGWTGSAYSIVAGAVFSALCTIVFSVFGTAHRRVAVQLLLPRARSLLFVIGACGALGDAASNPDVTQLLGANLAGLVSTFANMAAAISSAYFALAYRRPVAHLIRNRAYIHRHDHKLATEALEILASLWHIPILLIAIAAIIAMIDGRGMEGGVLQPSLVSALLLVLTLFLSALLLHLTRARNSRAQRRTPHLMRLLRFGGMLLIFGIWLAYIRFELDLWSGPVARLLKHGAMTPGVKYTLIALTTTVFGAWFVWILIDTIILGVVNSILQFTALRPLLGVSDLGADPAAVMAAVGAVGLLGLVGMLLGCAYEAIFVAQMGATPGKMALGMKVVRPDGSRVDIGRAVGRYFAKLLSMMILCIGYIMIGFDPEKRGLHDMICDTRVVRQRQ